MHIQFAHQTFKWSNEGKKNAAVHCVIIGFGPQEIANKRLFTYASPTSLPEEEVVSRLNPYLVDAPIVVLPNRRKPLCPVSAMIYGSKPADGGNLIMSDEQKQELLEAEPEAAPFVRQYAGSDEYISGTSRWCLWLKDAEPKVLRKLPQVMARVKRVEQMRLASDKPSTREWASSPTLFTEDRQPTANYLLVPRHSSEHRDYVPFGFVSAAVIVGDSCMAIPNASLYTFGVVTSAMHMAWLSYVCGRIKSDYRYSNLIVYNNFPWPDEPVAAARQAIEDAAQAVLDARAAYPDSTLADLYDPRAMPHDLRAAHRHLDKLVEHLYRRKAFKHDTERVQHLFEKYDVLNSPLAPAPAPPTPTRPRRRR